MVKRTGNNKSINDVEAFELGKLRDAAKIASIYHKRKQQFRRNENLSHVVQAGLQGTQFIVALSIEIFHHVHHKVNKQQQAEDDSIPVLPEERNPIFFIYPICMLSNIVFAILWLFKIVLHKRPVIALVGCFSSAIAMLVAGIIEMKHVDTHINLTEVSDDELLTHPVFLHNFIMCLLSILCMAIYLIQGWIIFDYWLWVKKQRNIVDDDDDLQVSDLSTDSDIIEGSESQEQLSKYESKGPEDPGELHLFPSLEKFSSHAPMPQQLSVDEEPVILYCCFVDCCNYIMELRRAKEPVHEFQVIHVL